jgi:hypothetical protein
MGTEILRQCLIRRERRKFVGGFSGYILLVICSKATSRAVYRKTAMAQFL